MVVRVKPFNTAQRSFLNIGSERCFGVELETSKVSSNNSHARMQDYMEECGTVFGAKYDDTCRGLEFYSPILRGDAGIDECINFCRAALEGGADVNGDCGYHAHFDLRDETGRALKNIALAYHYTYPVWRNCVASGRQHNTWCPMHRWSRSDVIDLPEEDNSEDFLEFAEHQGRYQWANFHAYCSHETLELRLHEGTLDPDEVTNWIKAHTRFIDAVAELSPARITRIFGRKSPRQLFRELRIIWQGGAVADFYASKVREHCSYVDKVLGDPKST